MTHTRGFLTAVLATTLLVAGCTESGPSAEDAADDLATALTSGKLAGAPLSGSTPKPAQQSFDDVVEGLGDAERRVSVVSVSEASDDGPATARLRWSWTLPGSDEPWSYTTTARLTDTGDTWTTRWSPALVQPSLRTGERLDLTTQQAERADILGAGGSALVTARTVVRFGIDKAQVSETQALAAARRLAPAVGIDVAPYVEQVRKAGPKAFVEAIVLRPADAKPVLATGVATVKGVGSLRDTLPLAPTREFARPILGSVGPVTAEIVKDSKGTYRAGDEAGLSGLQSRYDEQLRGTPGLTVRAVDTQGGTRDLFGVDPVAGKPLRTTLDKRLQQLAEGAVADVRPASAVVAIRPSTGDILAAASGPGGGGLNTATAGQYAPGSTFKVVSSLALLRAGLTPDSPMTCPATTVVDGKSFKNYDDYPASGLGRIPLRTAVANSCNTAFITDRDQVSQAQVADAAASLGLGVDHDLGFPAYFGSVPATDAEAGSETGHAASLIGQGRVTASPMAMAAVAASVAKGSTVVPRLLPDQPSDDVTPRTALTAAEGRQLRSLMRGVVTSGSGSFLASLPGPPVLAKTGTAEFGDQQPLQTHAWMIAVHGDLAVAVFVDVGESGSRTAGPVLERFLRAAG
ncbi:MAG: penicillin-binding protein [Nocardioidaceae bacterium]|nr:penicillin-binding protein [Nocardioidaceae bacterium]NUS52573.1 penicillin-binding protein [Nocardioidaceae bacterium]